MMNMSISALGSREMHIFGSEFSTPDGTAVRDYIHVVDLANAHIEAYRRLQGGAHSGVWNCGYGKGYSVFEMIQAFEKARKTGKDLANVDGRLVEVPVYSAARHLLLSASNTLPPPRRKPR